VLVKYVGDTFWDQLAPFENLRSIKDLKTKYEKVSFFDLTSTLKSFPKLFFV